MAQKLTERPAITSLTDDDLFHVVDDPAGAADSKKMTAVNAAKGLLSRILTTRGDMLRRGTSVPERVALGAAGSLMRSDGTDADWATLKTALGMTTRGDLVRGGASGVPERVGLGAAYALLRSDGTDAVWGAAGQLPFPSTRNPSADANTLDDYKESPWTPTVTAASGTLTTASATGSYTTIGRVVLCHVDVTITTNGTGATAINISLPFTASGYFTGCGRADAVSGKQLQVRGSSTSASIFNYDNTYPAASGEILRVDFAFVV